MDPKALALLSSSEVGHYLFNMFNYHHCKVFKRVVDCTKMLHDRFVEKLSTSKFLGLDKAMEWQS